MNNTGQTNELSSKSFRGIPVAIEWHDDGSATLSKEFVEQIRETGDVSLLCPPPSGEIYFLNDPTSQTGRAHTHRLPYIPRELRLNDGRGKIVTAICSECGQEFVHVTPPIEPTDKSVSDLKSNPVNIDGVKKVDDWIDKITEGLVTWATEFYREELERDANNTGVRFYPIVSPNRKSVPLKRAKLAIQSQVDEATKQAYELLRWKYKELNGQTVDYKFAEAYNILMDQLTTQSKSKEAEQ